MLAVWYNPIDLNDLAFQIKDFPDEYEPDIANPTFSPHFIQGDAATLLFPEQPDFVSGVQLLQYVDDPVAVIRNVVEQVERGGYILFTKLDRLSYTKQPTTENAQKSSLIQHVESLPEYRGFTILEWNDTIFFQKNNSDSQFPDFSRVKKTKQIPGFKYLYTDKN